MKKFNLLALLFASVLALPVLASSAGQSTVITTEQINWGYLNPLRGDRSPGAADLWGDRTKDTATGMLVRFNNGFSSPPHIHNISYRGVVIEGLMHNDDPSAEFMWLPSGSFWTQPAGENHITAASGTTNLIYLEIDSGPYLVENSAQHFDNGERPVNVHADNLVWLEQDKSRIVSGDGLAIAHLWQQPEQDLTGALVKLPADFNGKIISGAGELKAVVIKGGIHYRPDESTETVKLQPASYFESTGEFSHELSTTNETTIYIRSDSPYQVVIN